jgi:two-component system cell cycle response regulator
MVVDVDEFKQINDAHGHDVGDVVLRRAAAALKSGVRAQDVVCRFGGDEFLVICPDTTLEAALGCAERMRRAVEAAIITTSLPDLRCSISTGVAVRDDAMADPGALIKRADQGVFAAKERGRNRVVAV